MKQTTKNPLPVKLTPFIRQFLFFCLFLSLLVATLYILINSPA
jgi:hypothetical protein